MGKKRELVGKTFGNLLVVGLTSLHKNRARLWACQCYCRNLTLCTTEQLTYLGKVDCGCGLTQRKSLSATLHGYSIKNRKLYNIYKAMLDRCFNENNSEYVNYGGRGITVCDRWKDISAFFEDMENGYSEGLTLDREDVDGNYELSNCSWRDTSWQGYNKRQHSLNTSTKTGVSFNKERSLWEAYINKEGKRLRLGKFLNFEDAVKAREEAEIECYGRLKGN